jgi:hypothetical protein
MLDGITFLKRQQWAVTNYLALIYAALIWYGRNLRDSTGSISPRLFFALSITAIVAAIVAIGLLIWFQHDTGELRKRITRIHMSCFNENEQDVFGLQPYAHPYGRGWHVLVALIMVCAFGAILVIFSVQ